MTMEILLEAASLELYKVQIRKVERIEYESLDPGSFLGCRVAHFCFKAKHLRTDQVCLIDREFCRSEAEHKNNIKKRVQREVSILRSLSCDHVINCIDVFEHENWIYRVYDSFPERYFNADVGWDFKPETVRSIMRQLFVALSHCHSKKIAHSYVKPLNLLLIPHNDRENESYHVKLSVFDFAHHFLDDKYYPASDHFSWGFEGYYSPELLLSETLSSNAMLLGDAASDIWAAGVTFIELFSKRSIFSGDCKIDSIFKIFRQLGTPNNISWPGVVNLPNYNTDFPRWNATPWPKEARLRLNEEGLNLLGKLLSLDPKRRITAEKALQHSYFKL